MPSRGLSRGDSGCGGARLFTTRFSYPLEAGARIPERDRCARHLRCSPPPLGLSVRRDINTNPPAALRAAGGRRWARTFWCRPVVRPVRAVPQRRYIYVPARGELLTKVRSQCQLPYYRTNCIEFIEKNFIKFPMLYLSESS